MSLQSLTGHTAWMGFGNSATPPLLCPSTGATASCLLSLASLLLFCGASCSLASPSATSGPWFPASRAAWSSHSASAASTPSASRPSVIPSLKPWARSSAVCALQCAKKSKNSHCSVYSMIGWSAVSFYTPEVQSRRFSPSYSSSFLHNMPFPTHPSSSCVLICLVCLLPPEAQWQLQQAAWFCDSSGTPAGLSASHWGRRGLPAMTRICL